MNSQPNRKVLPGDAYIGTTWTMLLLVTGVERLPHHGIVRIYYIYFMVTNQQLQTKLGCSEAQLDADEEWLNERSGWKSLR